MKFSDRELITALSMRLRETRWQVVRDTTGISKTVLHTAMALFKATGQVRATDRVEQRRRRRCDRIFNKGALTYLHQDIEFEKDLYADERSDRAYKEYLSSRRLARVAPSPSTMYRAFKVRSLTSV